MNLIRERGLWKRGYKRVVGIDEAGRGPLAGPVVAAALIVFPSASRVKNQGLNTILKEVKDSKKVSGKKREKLYELLLQSEYIKWGRGRVSEKVIDRINILEATKLAMKRSVKNLEKKLKKKADFLILDGSVKINLNVDQEKMRRADEKVFSVAAASIIAKVTRDRTMKRYHKMYSKYGFAKHKGYPTKEHKKKLRKYGPCKIHRRSFKPLRNIT